MMCSNFQGVRQCLAHNFGQQCNSSHAVECAERLISTHGVRLFPALRSLNWKCLSFIPCLSWKLSLCLSLIIIPAACIMFVLARALPPPWLYPKSTMRCQEAWFPNVIPEQTERRAQNGARARQCFSRCMQKVTFSRERAHTPENENACWNAAAWHKLICKLLNRPHTHTHLQFPRPVYRFSSLFFFSRTHPPHALALFFPLLLPPSIFFGPCMCFSLRTQTHTQSCAGCVLLPGRIRVRAYSLTQLVARNVLGRNYKLSRANLCLLQGALFI